MCLIIENKTKENLFSILPKSDVLMHMQNNPDGFGITYFYPEDNHIKTVKGFTSNEFLSYLEMIESQAKFNYYIHFRQATVGKISIENTHPFDVLGDNSLFLMHNGTLPSFKDNQNLDTTHSDTYFLSQSIKHIIETYGREYIHEETFKKAIEELLGVGRAVLISGKKSILFNEHLWFPVVNKLLFSKNLQTILA